MPAPKDGWLNQYYQRLLGEYQFSLTRRDHITTWALTLFLGVVAAYAGILTSQIAVPEFWRVALLLASIGLLLRFFSQSMIAYSFLRRWRFLENKIESYWLTGEPSVGEIVSCISTYDHGRRTTVSKSALLWSQLRAGFLLIFLVLSGILSVELASIVVTAQVILLFMGFVLYVIWELVIFLTYDQLKRPSDRMGK